jgi:hypothetical protein
MILSHLKKRSNLELLEEIFINFVTLEKYIEGSLILQKYAQRIKNKITKATLGYSK